MPGLLIIAHAPLASALKSVAGHTFPDCAAPLEVLDVPPDMPLEQIEHLARELLARVRNPEALILTDVFGNPLQRGAAPGGSCGTRTGEGRHRRQRAHALAFAVLLP